MGEPVGALRWNRRTWKLLVLAYSTTRAGLGQADAAASEPSNQLDPSGLEPIAAKVDYQVAGTIALLTLEAKATNGAKALIYSNPNPGLELEAAIVHEILGRRATLGGAVHSQSLTFDKSIDGQLPPTEIRSNDVVVFSLFPWLSGWRLGPTIGSMGEPMPVAKGPKSLQIQTLQTPYVGGRLVYNQTMITVWEMGGQFDAGVLLPAKAAGVSAAAGGVFAATGNLRYVLNPDASFGLSYTFKQEMQNSVKYRIKRGEDIFALVFSSSFAP